MLLKLDVGHRGFDIRVQKHNLVAAVQYMPLRRLEV